MNALEVIAVAAASLVLGFLLGKSAAGKSPPAPVPPPPPSKLDEIRKELRAGNKIQAIKMYREQTGAGLKDAKDAIERLED